MTTPAEVAVAIYQAPGYSAYNTVDPAAAQAVPVVATVPAANQDVYLSPHEDFTRTDIDLTLGSGRSDPTDISETMIARNERSYFRRLDVNEKMVDVAIGTGDGRLSVKIGPGDFPFELLVRTPTLTCNWSPSVWPLGDNKHDYPDSKYGAETTELYNSKYYMTVVPYATDAASADASGRNIHAVHFFNWCHRLTMIVHKKVCEKLPSVVSYAASKMLGAYNAMAMQTRQPLKKLEEAEAMFRENGFQSPLKQVIDKSSMTRREGSHYMAFGGKVFQKITDGMKARYEKEVPPMPHLDASKPYAPTQYIHQMWNQRTEFHTTQGPMFGKPKDSYIFKDVPLVLLRGPQGRPFMVPYEMRQGLLTKGSIVSCLIGISFSISDKTGLLMMNLSLKRVTYCGENASMPGGGSSLEDELSWDTSSVPSLTIPPGLAINTMPLITDVTTSDQLQITAGTKHRAEEDDDGLSDTERNERLRRRIESDE